jgi:hypothetical protein
MNQIQDEFTGVPMSRQQRWQMRKRRDGRCIECGKRVLPGRARCGKHLKLAREREAGR